MKKLMLIFLFAVAGANMYAQNTPNDRPLLEKKDVKHIKASVELLLGAGAIVYGLNNVISACSVLFNLTSKPECRRCWSNYVYTASYSAIALVSAAVAYAAIKWGLEDLKEAERKIY